MTYTVQPGDTLNGIAIRLLGRADLAATLFDINKSRIKSGSPSTLAAGEQLIVPDQMIAASKAARQAPKDSTEVILLVNGLEYGGWTSVSISRSLETAAAAFQVGLLDKWQEGQEPWPIFDGDEVRVYIGADLMIEGYVDEVGITLDDQNRGMTVSGRDRTADLVDCSAMNRPGTFKNKKLEDLAGSIAQPFGIEVTADVDTGPPIASFTLLPGEKVHEAIARAAIARNFIVTSGPNGSLLITRSGARRAADAIVEGKNLRAGQSNATSTDRYSDYFVEGQSSGAGKAAKTVRGTYHDPAVRRYRPLMIHADAKATAQNAKDRAEFEARARAAKSRSGGVTVVGWRQSNGELWTVNRIVRTSSPSLGLDEDLLIAEIMFDLQPGSGQTTNLRLVREDAYTSAEELRADKDALRSQRVNKHGKGKGKGERKVTQAEIDAANRDAAQGGNGFTP